MILAKLHELWTNAMSYDADLKIAYSEALRDYFSGKISYALFIDKTDTIQDEFRFRVMKTLDSKWIWF